MKMALGFKILENSLDAYTEDWVSKPLARVLEISDVRKGKLAIR
jgi:hypothetical protein